MNQASFIPRHIGPDALQLKQMLDTLGVPSLDTLIDQTVPASIRMKTPPDLPAGISEQEYLQEIRSVARKNSLYRSFIGAGYYNTFTPPVIQRNLFENPGWYTQYTPYQAEISQGRLESLLNFQTMVIDLTGLPVTNASLLDEGTAAAEGMTLLYHSRESAAAGRHAFLVSDQVFPQTLDLLRTRANPLGIEICLVNPDQMTWREDAFGLFLQYPDNHGEVKDYRALIASAHARGIRVVMAADLLSLCLLTPPGELGADVACGSAQRFGVPLGYGGPHAAYFSAKEEFKRSMPGRIIGVSVDAQGNPAYRMALQTREQHIKREKATSNICTAQALLANMAAMYAVYHGPEGLRDIASTIHHKAGSLAAAIEKLGLKQLNEYYFDTLRIAVPDTEKIRKAALSRQINLRYLDSKQVGISLDETTTWKEVQALVDLFAIALGKSSVTVSEKQEPHLGPLTRQSEYLSHPVFHRHHSETRMMRYLKELENKDLSLTNSMISLGSCTMKLNAAAEMYPVSFPEFATIHPFVPLDQVKGYQQMIEELERFLCAITGFSACSLQPNSGAQGEYAGLMVIRAYHADQGQSHRNIALIPQSAHGTNPASAVMAGMKVVVVKTDENGNIDLADLKARATEHKNDLSCLMVTYPSTHGVFEESIQDVCRIIHEHGGLVYMDGANMNAQVGLTAPALIGADVNHINLHKTFSIPHGGGGPGMGPICVNDLLKPYLPGHTAVKTGGSKPIHAVSAAPWGSASILLISYAYIKMLGLEGCKAATEYAILNANYMKCILEKEFPVLYVGKNGRCAHEMIIDMRSYKKYGIEVEDIAKRLMDYGFHAPTVSFPVPGTLMIEPTESESKDELDRFCQALISIKREMESIVKGSADKDNNLLKNAPHTAALALSDTWSYPYSRAQAVFPLHFVKQRKFWPSVARINNTVGDRNLICSCPPVEDYAAELLPDA